MKRLRIILILVAVYIASFLVWPAFAYSSECAGFGGSGGCVPYNSYKFNDFELGGGWRWMRTHNCIQDGRLEIFSTGICAAEKEYEDEYPPRVAAFATIGSLVVTVIAGLILFYPMRRRASRT